MGPGDAAAAAQDRLARSVYKAIHTHRHTDSHTDTQTHRLTHTHTLTYTHHTHTHTHTHSHSTAIGNVDRVRMDRGGRGRESL